MHRALRTTLQSDWSKLDVRSALCCAPVIATILIAGIVTHHSREAVMATAGAFSAGFGTFHRVFSSRTLTMLLASFGMAISSWLGTLAGLSNAASVIIAALWAFVYGIVSEISADASWVGLQCLVWLVISTAYPQHGRQALSRGIWVLIGGIAQTVTVTVISRLRSGSADGTPPLQFLRVRQAFHQVLHCCTFHAYPFRAAVTLALATALYRWTGLPNGYWVPMTAALVIRPALPDALQRGISRIAGTILGAALATLIAVGLHPAPAMLAWLIALFTFGCYLLVNVNYALFSIFVTAYVVFLLSLAGLQEQVVVLHRVLNTTIGGLTALVTYAALQRTPSPENLPSWGQPKHRT